MDKSKPTNIALIGLGGQGIVTLAKLITETYYRMGKKVIMYENKTHQVRVSLVKDKYGLWHKHIEIKHKWGWSLHKDKLLMRSSCERENI